MIKKKIKTIDYIITLLIIFISAYLFATIFLAKYLSISFLVYTTNINFVLASFSQIIVPILIGFLYLYIRYYKYFNYNLKRAFKNINYKVILGGYILVLIIWIIYSWIISLLWLKEWDNIFNAFANTHSIWVLSIFTGLWILAAIYEELIFRWILFDLFLRFFWWCKIFFNKRKEEKIKKEKGKRKIDIVAILTIIITAILFWFMHLQYSIVLIVNVILIWLVLWFIRYKYWIINSIFIHVINNFVIIFWTMLLPLIFSNIVYQKIHDNNLISLRTQFENEENIFLQNILKKQVISNKWITNNLQINQILKNSKENIYNPYIYKYFFLPSWKYSKCIFSKNKNKKWCKMNIPSLKDRFIQYEKLYKKWLIKKYQYNHILQFLNFMNKMYIAHY